MWENVIGLVNEERGANADVEALINAPKRGGGRQAAQARRAAAAEAVLATGAFDTAITNYDELLTLAKSQGAVGGGATRGACKICGQLGHLTKQCRNQFSKFFNDQQQQDADRDPAQQATEGQNINSSVVSGLASDSELSDLSDSDNSDDGRHKSSRRRKSSRRHGSSRRHKSSRDEERSHRESRDRRRHRHHKRRRHRSPSRSRSRSRSRD